MQYLSPSRKAFVQDTMPDEELSRLTNLWYGLGYSYTGGRHNDSPAPPDVIAYAFEQQLLRLKAGFDAKDEAYLQQGLQERPNALFIGRQTAAREALGIDDVPAWVNERMARHPANLTAGIGFIEFVDGMGQTQTADGTIWNTRGHLSPLENTVRIDLCKDMIARMTAEHGGYDSAALRQAIRNINRAQIAQTFDHELAHYEHEQRLPVAWLMEWQQVVDQEQLNLTDYVHNMRSDDPSNHGDPDAEDLAETAALYLNEPWSLLTAAPMRFDIFNRRDGRYSQALLAEADALLQQYGANSSNVKMLDAMLVGRVEAPPAPKTVGPAPIEMDAA